MQQQFEKFCKNIKLTKNQRGDAKRKYKGVCTVLHNKFYETKYNGNTKYLFGSYRKRTAIRPLIESQDVDVLFKMPEEMYETFQKQQNGQSALLQLVRRALIDSKYALSEKPKAWGKVILVQTADGTHNVELLPAFEQMDGRFIIPNTENGGSWEIFDPRNEIDTFKKSDEETEGLTSELSRIIKRWAREVSSLALKSYEIETHVVSFLRWYSYKGVAYSVLVKDFFVHLSSIVNAENKSYVDTAKNRAEKAVDFEKNEKYESSTEEWQKIFGNSFPNGFAVHKNIFEGKNVSSEEFIEQQVNEVNINPYYKIDLDCEVKQDGFREALLSKLTFGLRKNKGLDFFIKETNVPRPYSIKWKVRNFGKEAEQVGQLRGEITDDKGKERKTERTAYRGEHFVECYIIKDDVCVARQQIIVPIELSTNN